VPVHLQGEAYGGLALYYGQPRSFSVEDVELAILFSNQASLAIENARLKEQAERAAASAERSRLARDLHDSVTQALFSASLVAEILPRVWQRDPDEALDGLQKLRRLTRGALSEMRTMLLELRPAALMETRLHELLEQLTEAVIGRVQLQAVLDLEPIPALPSDVHVAFYRVAQEALNNVVKHAEASQVIVSLRASPPLVGDSTGQWQGQVILHVRDDGQGFEPDSVARGRLGLTFMRERARSVGAVLTVDTQEGRGTQVSLVWQA
jgi:signal transduction histidine kinase